MKVRIGIGAGSATGEPAALAALVGGISDHGFDSLWLSEVLTGSAVDPLVGMAWAAGHQPRLKVGTTLLLPGRNPLRLAKSLASLDRLSGGRLLVTAVPGLPTEPERDAVGEPFARRGVVIDEVLPLLRELWSGHAVTWTRGELHLEEVRLDPLPVQDPLEVWLGGNAPAALRRCGRLGDGWLPALCTPEQAAEGRRVVEREAAAAGRSISDEHFGVSIGYARQPLTDTARRTIARRARDADPDAVVPSGLEALRVLVERFVAEGVSKFVLRPLDAPADWAAELAALAGSVADLQT